jgi:hypothetical protein
MTKQPQSLVPIAEACSVFCLTPFLSSSTSIFSGFDGTLFIPAILL